MGLAAGFLFFSARAAPVASRDAIAAAQRASYWGANPIWIDHSGEERLFRQVRDRAFAYCYRDGGIPRACAQEQDGAVQATVLTLMTVEAQRRMPDRSSLSVKERWIAENPEIVAHARSLCWAHYNVHGGRDARLLSICLSNLIETSEIVPLPAVD